MRQKIQIDKILFTITVWIFLSLNAQMFNFSFYAILRWILPVILLLMVSQKKGWKVPAPATYIFLFIIAVIPSFFQSIDWSTSVSKAISFILITYSFYVFFIGADNLVKLEDYLRIALACILVFQLINIVFCVIGLGVAEDGRYMGFTTNANTLGIYSCLGFWAAYYYYKHYNGIIKWFAAFMLLSSIVLALLSGSRSGFVMILLNIIIYMFLNCYSSFVRFLVIILVGIMLYLIFSGSLSFLNISALDRLLAEDGMSRGDIWDTGINVWRENQIFGCGYRVSRLLNTSIGNEGMDFHNSYLSLLAEIGIWGVSWMFFGVVPKIIQLIRYATNMIKQSHASGFLVAGFMLVSLMINAWSESFLFSVGSTEAFVFWMLFDWMIVYIIKME